MRFYDEEEGEGEEGVEDYEEVPQSLQADFADGYETRIGLFKPEGKFAMLFGDGNKNVDDIIESLLTMGDGEDDENNTIMAEARQNMLKSCPLALRVVDRQLKWGRKLHPSMSLKKKMELTLQMERVVDVMLRKLNGKELERRENEILSAGGSDLLDEDWEWKWERNGNDKDKEVVEEIFARVEKEMKEMEEMENEI